MSPNHRFTWLICMLSVAGAAAANLTEMPSGKYTVDKTHAYINFSYSHLGFSTPTVGFADFDVDLHLDSANPERSTLAVVIDVASVDSRVDEFNEHLRGEDYFDVAQHPTITFKASSIEMTSPTTAMITGDLTIKGVTKAVTLDASLNKAGMHPLLKAPTLGISATTRVKRSEWGLGRAVPLVSDEVDINITAELPREEEYNANR